jgi:subtilisin family serine protease
MKRRLVLMAAVLAGADAAAQPVPNAQTQQTQQIQGLVSRAEKEGRARVIVGVSLDRWFRAEGDYAAATDVDEQRAAISVAQDRAANLVIGLGGEVHARFRFIPFFVATIGAQALQGLARSPLVTGIYEDRLNEPLLAQSVPIVGGNVAWGAGLTGSGWTVAVIDTGVDKTHPFLAGKVVSEACYSTNSASSQSMCPGGVSSSTAPGSGVNCSAVNCEHGTHVAGIATGLDAPGGFSGVAKNASLIAIDVFSYFPSTNKISAFDSDIIQGLERVYALRSTFSIASVNMSLGGGQYTSTCDSANASMKAAIDNLRSDGIAVVVASGNNGYRSAISYPACISTAVSVGSTCDAGPDSDRCQAGVDGVAAYSNITSFVTLVAPGSYITSSVPGGGYDTYNGTSMAAPHVAGAWALLKQQTPTIPVSDAISMLRGNAVTVDDTRSSGVVTGLKLMDLKFLAGSTYPLTVSRVGSGTVTSNPPGIDCGGTCSAPFAPGTVVALTPSAGSGATFAGWSGDADCSDGVVTMNGPRACTATFTGGTSTPLTNGQTVADLSGALGSEQHFYIDVPSGTTSLVVETWGGTGDVDLYVRLGSAPTTSTFDCQSWAYGNAETCTHSSPDAGRWHVMLHGYEAFSGVNLRATFTVPVPTALANGQVVANLSGVMGSEQHFYIDVPSGTSNLTVRTWGGTGDVDLYVRLGALAMTDEFDCRSWTYENAEECTISPPAAGRWYVMLHAYDEFAGVSLQASYGTGHVLTVAGLGSGTVTSNPPGIDCGSTCSAQFPAGQVVTLSAVAAAGWTFDGWSGDADCSDGVVTMSATRACTALFLRGLANGQAVTGLSGTMDSDQHFYIDVPSGATNLVVQTTGGAGDVDLYVRLGGLASTVAFDCRSWTYTTSEICTFPTPAAGRWYVMLHAYGSFSNTTLQATFTPGGTGGYLLSVTKSGSGNGTVTSSPAGISCGVTCSANFPAGQVVTLSAVAVGGSTFTGWLGDADCADGVVTMTGARLCTAVFTRPPLYDFTGDGLADRAVYRAATGTWYIQGQGAVTWGVSDDVAVAADYDGNGTTDIAVWRPSTGTWYVRGQFTGQYGARYDVPVPADYDGNGAAEIAVWRPSTGTWFIAGRAPVQWGAAGDVPVPGDYDGDGQAEVAVYQPGTATWFIEGQAPVVWGEARVVPVPADYNGDGMVDIAVFNRTTGEWAVRGGAARVLGQGSDLPVPLDVDGDGRAEFGVWRVADGMWSTLNPATNATTAIAYGTLGDVPLGLPRALAPPMARATAADMDGDALVDLTLFRASAGMWYSRLSTGGLVSTESAAWGVPGDVPVTGSYLRVGHAHRAVWRSATGQWLIQGLAPVTWGAVGDVPVPADYDGDGLTDLTVWRPAGGTWFIRLSSSGYAVTWSFGWGASGDVPFGQDLDGDGRADLGIYRAGTWFVRLSASGFATTLQRQWGGAGDVPVAADYDGDGRADIAVWRPATGEWFLLGSGSGFTAGQLLAQWGAASAGDVPVPGDYTGDGRADVAVFREPAGLWFLRGLGSIQWGGPGDVPIGKRP